MAGLRFDRKAERYRGAVDWARWIVALLAPALRAGPSEAPALLFDMNRLFESDIANVVRQRLGHDRSVEVSAQDTSHSLVRILSAGHEEPGFTLKPDLVIRRGNAVSAIADTKWKAVRLDTKRRPMPNEADVYQMHAYATAFRCTDLWLIYPWRSSLADAVDTEFRLPRADGRHATLRVVCVDVYDDELPLRLGGPPAS